MGKGRVSPREYATHWEGILKEAVASYGGYVNAHAHLDRANTTDKAYLSHVGLNPLQASAYPLAVKQSLTGDLHKGPAYARKDLERRLREVLNASIAFNTRQIWSLIDTTNDEARDAFAIALEMKEKYKERIDLKLAAYPIFGFKDSIPERWETFEAAAQKADFLAALPERDEGDGRVGYDEHLKRILSLGKKLGKQVHVHVDQGNVPWENGTETLIDAVRWIWPENFRGAEKTEPMVWAIHAISPSCYTEERFQKVADGMKKYNIGFVCCPSAAIGMRQYRCVDTPTHNSIARVWDFVAKKIPVQLGTDNICDVFIPSGHPDMFMQVWRLADDTRFYIPSILAKLACGIKLNDVDIDSVQRVLEEDKRAFEKVPKPFLARGK